MLRGQFDWGGRLLKSNGGAQRFPQRGWKSRNPGCVLSVAQRPAGARRPAPDDPDRPELDPLGVLQHHRARPDAPPPANSPPRPENAGAESVESLRLGDEVLFIHQGRLAEHTPIETFFRQPASAEAAAFVKGELPWI